MPKVKTIKIRKPTPVEDEQLVKAKAGKKTKLIIPTKAEVAAISDPFNDYYIDRLDAIEKTYGLSSGTMEKGDRVSTGMLVIDIILSGGIAGHGMVSIAGPEASSKSTQSTHMFGAALQAGMMTHYHDPEGSLDPEYSGNILRVSSLESIFGSKDAKGNWAVKPHARYYDDNTLETFFDFNKDFLMSLPDKSYISETDKWYYRFKPDRDGIKDRIAKMGLKIDKDLYQTTKMYYCETPKRGAQAMIFCDSWPSLLSEDQDQENKDRSKAMAFNARKFSEYLPQVVGKLRRKSVILAGVNQIRTNPMAYGNPNYEPGGAALKFYSSARNQIFAKTIPHDVKKPIEEEPSVWGKGTDKYAYKYIQNTKNKQATPYRDGWLRVWVSDSNGQGRGYCYVWDQYQYYLLTGRIKGTRNKFKLLDVNGIPAEKVWTWLDFKKYVLAEGKEQRGIAAQMIKSNKYIDMRKQAFAELKSGTGMKLYNSAAANKIKPSVEDMEE